MCRSIRPLNNLAPPASAEEVRAAALQYVRKVSGSAAPSRGNAPAFAEAVDTVAAATAHLLEQLTTTAPPRDRQVLAERARARAAVRYARPAG